MTEPVDQLMAAFARYDYDAKRGDMPNQPKTPGRNFRIPPDLHAQAKQVAASRGETLTAVITEALRRYVSRNANPTPKEN